MPQLTVYVTKMQKLSIYLAVNVTFRCITDARSYRHTNTEVLIVRQQA